MIWFRERDYRMTYRVLPPPSAPLVRPEIQGQQVQANLDAVIGDEELRTDCLRGRTFNVDNHSTEDAAGAFARLSAEKKAMADRDAFNFFAAVLWVFLVNPLPRRGASYTPLTTQLFGDNCRITRWLKGIL